MTLLIFDCDGVLVDSELLAHAALAELMSTLGHCVASSSTRERLDLSLQVTGLEGLFGDRVFSAYQVEHGKPAPDLYLLAARSFALKPANCIVIEDSTLGIRAAVAAGMKTIGFAGASHASAELAQQLKMAGANVVIAAMSDLPSAVEGLVAARS